MPNYGAATQHTPEFPNEDRVGTGIAGLDLILGGGLSRDRLFLIEGTPGSGKTTLALQFLLAGAARDETVLYVTLSESNEELCAVARSHGWDPAPLHVLEVIPSDKALDPDSQYTVFHPSDVELSDAFRTVLGEVERLKPKRVVIDSLSELRLLAEGPLQFRRQLLALKHFFSGRKCTVIVLDDQLFDLQIQSIAHGVIRIEQLAPSFGPHRRRLQIIKSRGIAYRGGFHDLVIRRGGILVFPRIVAADRRGGSERAMLSSAVAEVDRLTGGGVERGTSTLITGAAGTGKSTLAMQFALAAAERGEGAAVFTFDESVATLTTRMRGLGMHADRHVESGAVQLHQVDPAELSPGEFMCRVADAARQPGMSVLVIDSLNGFMQSMPDENFLGMMLHELLTYLGQTGVATIVVSVQHGLIGTAMQSPIDASYIADTVILLRYFEAFGEVRKAISIMKKRGGAHERTLSEFSLDGRGVQVGNPLRDFRGVLTGVPVYEGGATPLHKA